MVTIEKDDLSVRVKVNGDKMYYCLYDITKNLGIGSKGGNSIKEAIERAFKRKLSKSKIGKDDFSFIDDEQLEYFLRCYSTSAELNAFLREIPYRYKSYMAKQEIAKESQKPKVEVEVPSVVEKSQSSVGMELVKISKAKVGEQNINAVNARDLWVALESKQDFSSWIKARIEKLGLVESRDYGVFHKVMENLSGGRPAKEYVVSIDIAKHLAMIEMTDKGRQVREYFIECEKQLIQSFKTPTNMVEALELALEQAKEIESLKTQAIENAPKVVAYDKLMDTHNNISIKEFGKIIGMGEKNLFKWLRDNSYLMADNKPYQRYIDRGYFEVVEKTCNIDENRSKNYTQTLITPKGQGYLSNKIKS